MIIDTSDLADFKNRYSLQNKKIVLIGGCFDILHIGHLTLLEKSKQVGEILVVLLEGDQTIKRLKGDNRPVFSQSDRAKMLDAIKYVDLVILLGPMSDQGYDELIQKISPDVIATTKGDKSIHHKHRVAELVGATVEEVTGEVSDQSTTSLIRKLGID